MKLSLLNKTVHIQEYRQVTNSSGDVSNTLVTIDADVKIRITTNKKVTDYSGNSFGIFEASTHLGFCLIDTIVVKGNVVLDGSIKYNVDYVDKIPGGKLDSHYQIYMTLVE